MGAGACLLSPIHLFAIDPLFAIPYCELELAQNLLIPFSDSLMCLVHDHDFLDVFRWTESLELGDTY